MTINIAIIAQPFDTVLPPTQNSIGLIIQNTVRLLATRASVTVYLPKSRGSQHVFRDDNGVTYRPVETSRDVFMLKILRRVPVARKKLTRVFDFDVYYYFYIKKIALDARKRHFDVVQIVDFSQYAPIFKRYNPSTKIVLEMHCEWLVQLNRTKIRRRLGYVDAVAGCSNHISEGVIKAMPDLSMTSYTIYNGFDEARFLPKLEKELFQVEDAKVLLFVGRVSPEKGVHDLIEAMAEVLRHEPKCRLQIIGWRGSLPLDYIVGLSDEEDVRGLARFYDGSLDTDYQAYLERRVTELEMQGSVDFVGAVPQKDLPERYREAKVLVNPSYSESFGMSVLEGMAVGLPVVATAVGGMKELVEVGKTGYLVDRGKPAQLAEALLKIIQDDDRCRAMGKEGVERAKTHFSWKRRADDIWSMYQSIT